MSRGVRTAWLLAALVVLAVACGSDEPAATPGEGCRPQPPEQLVAEVVRVVPHDPEAYTQGLVMHQGRLFESTGLVGESTLRELDPDTGDVLARRDLDPEVFGEGLAVGADGRLVQLTWKDGVAYEWDPDTLESTREFSYEGEGWGLTTLDDGTLVMSDGSDTLVLRDPEDFGVVESHPVRRSDGPSDQLNELEWDGESIWANRYRTDEIVRIDPACWTVTGVLDAGDLRADAIDAAPDGEAPEVTNGIAHLPGADRYLLTGKRWPRIYEVTIRPA